MVVSGDGTSVVDGASVVKVGGKVTKSPPATLMMSEGTSTFTALLEERD